MNVFMEWLEGRSREVSRLEAEGKKKIVAGDMNGYRAIMREKAELLADLAVDGIPLAASLPALWKTDAISGLRGFSTSAEHALSLDSVFYMSALLFPEDYREGQAHDLEVFLNRLKTLVD